MSYLGQALRTLRPAHNFRVENGTDIIWLDERQQPTEKEINDKVEEIQAEYDAKKYQRDRQYPSLGEQFDLLFKDIDSGKVSKDGGFYKAIKSVKDAHPKPSE